MFNYVLLFQVKRLKNHSSSTDNVPNDTKIIDDDVENDTVYPPQRPKSQRSKGKALVVAHDL